MSRADIVQVTTLAAHLADKWRVANPVAAIDPAFPWSISDPTVSVASGCARDAMLLQKLGARAMRAMDKYSSCEAGRLTYHYSEEEMRDEWERVTDQANAVLAPYGLKAECRDEPFRAECLYIIGLPGNDLGSTTDGFQI